MIKKIIIPLFFIISIWSFSQERKVENTEIKSTESTLIIKKLTDKSADVFTKKQNIELSPTKAGLYSTVFPGMGQVYNKMYWKVPLVWGAIGTCVGIASWNHKQYRRYRDAFLDELSGRKHEFSDISGVTLEILGRTQDNARRKRDYLIAVTAGVYILNIIDAIVDAHLLPMKKDPDFAFLPAIVSDYSGITDINSLGVSFKYRF